MAEMSSLKVLNAVVALPESRVGGAERAGLRFGDALSNHAVVDNVKMEGEMDSELFKNLDLSSPIHQIPSRTFLRDMFNGIWNTDTNMWNILVWTKLSPPKPISEYDIVHIHNAVPLAGMVGVAIQSRLASVPYCVTTHGISKIPEIPDELEFSSMKSKLFQVFFLIPYYYTLRKANHLFALSEKDEATLLKKFSNQSVSILRNGVNVREKVSVKPPSERYISHKVPTILYVGRIMKSKGIDDLLSAFRKVDAPSRLLIVGPIRDSEYHKRMSDQKWVKYLGFVEQDELNYLYSQADIFAFPTRSDVFPLVTLEAMASETPVVSTTVGGLPEQIPRDAGILLPPKQPEQFADALEELLNDENKRAAMGENAFRHVSDEYSWDSVAIDAIEIYEKLLAGDSRP